MSGPTVEAQLARLWAIHEIQQLVYRYALAFDRRDRELFCGLWAPADGTAEFPDLDGELVARNVDRFFAHGPSVMVVANHLIDFTDDDHAVGHVYGWPQVEMAGRFVDQIVLYRDRYVRREGAWRFATRRHLLIYGQERAENPFAQAPADWPRGQVGRGVERDALPPYPPVA